MEIPQGNVDLLEQVAISVASFNNPQIIFDDSNCISDNMHERSSSPKSRLQTLKTMHACVGAAEILKYSHATTHMDS